MKIREIYRCRFCGKLLFEDAGGKQGSGPFSKTITKWMFNEPAESTLLYGGVAEEQFKNTILHRCDTSTISVCDFVGIDRVSEDEECAGGNDNDRDEKA